ncbi:MAG: hypothetical protein IKR17_05760 [Bacteroidales bacterium]|nr:hypothetical protein [Bacteroidales bacterium]
MQDKYLFSINVALSYHTYSNPSPKGRSGFCRSPWAVLCDGQNGNGC